MNVALAASASASASSGAAPAPIDTPLALEPLKELPLPAPVSYLPQTIGWVLLAILLALALALLAFIVWRRRRRSRYRRLALRELARIEADLQLAAADDSARRAAALAAIPVLLKRTALAATSRERVAALSGDAWLAFLAQTQGHFDAVSCSLIRVASYAPAAQLSTVSPRDADALVMQSRDWMQHHRVEI